MAGYVRVSREFFDDGAFADEAFTEREAFLWLIFEASFRVRERRIGSAVVMLQRGQVAASTRFMAKAWRWSEARVRRYLDRLKNRRMATCAADAGVTVITLCNYDKYQAPERVADAGPTHQPTQQRRTGDANENKDAIRDKVETIVSTKRASARDPLVPIIGDELTDAWIAHRRAIRKPLTPQAASMLAGKLVGMRDPPEAVRRSIANGWTGVFEDDRQEKQDGQHSRRVSAFLAGARR